MAAKTSKEPTSTAQKGLQLLLEECPVDPIESVTPDNSNNKQAGSDKDAAAAMEQESPLPEESLVDSTAQNQSPAEDTGTSQDDNVSITPSPTSFLSRFKDPSTCMWTASHEANNPSEDYTSSLVNVLLRPEQDKHALVRLSLWSVIDGHGGGCVATYASEVLLPHVCASVAQSLNCEVVHYGECRVNGELRDANAIDFQVLLQPSSHEYPNSIHYRTPIDDFGDDEEGSGTTSEIESDNDSGMSLGSSLVAQDDFSPSSVESSVQSPSQPSSMTTNQTGPTGTHSIDEVTRVITSVTESFCAVDEGWINSIDVATTHQTSCEPNGAWNAGACALVVFTVQRLEWTNDVEDGDGSETIDEMVNTCSNYRPHDAMLYTAHVGDCRAVLLGDEPPIKVHTDGTLTIDYGDEVTESVDNSSFCNDDVTEWMGSSSDDADSSDDESLFLENSRFGATPPHMRYMTRPSRSRRLRSSTLSSNRLKQPFVPLPPIDNKEASDVGSSSDESEDDLQPARKLPRKNRLDSRCEHDISKQQQPGVLNLSSLARSFVLTNDHNAYNASEAEAVLLRSNNAPKAISSRRGGIRRVAGSLAVTRALGDAYLKTPLVCRSCGLFVFVCKRIALCSQYASLVSLFDFQLSFHPYRRHAPYITARPEVTHRLLKGGDPKTNSNVLILASDGLWDKASGEDVLRWLRNYSAERIAAAEREHSGDNDERPSSPESFADENDGTPRKRKFQLGRRSGLSKRGGSASMQSNPAEVVVRRVLNKVRRSKNLSMQELLALPPGKSRRGKHDDTTAQVVDIGAFLCVRDETQY